MLKRQLKIQFFGSDQFSLASLAAVHQLARHFPNVVSSLDLVVRRLKPSGRGQNTIRVPDVVQYAEENGVKWSEAETPADFQALLDQQPDMAIAVSYGQFIPGLYLRNLPYGGLNVHPSLLPLYKGAAPIQRAIMDRQPTTGVSVQTLDDKKFDNGSVLWQSRPVPIAMQTTFVSLRRELAGLGAEGLCEVLTRGTYLDPQPRMLHQGTTSWARPIDRDEYRVDFTKPMAHVDATGRALERLYFEQLQTTKKNKAQSVRILLSDFVPVNISDTAPIGTITQYGAGESSVLALRVFDGYIGARTVTVAGQKPSTANMYFAKRTQRGLGDRATIC